ncbi:hypothetical protein [Streptomyces sp. ALB3]|uniref:hypothetical protein n=1 Tax=Streptomyces sp. ALB3 TaxID=3374278 RepID=UPI0037BCED44
MADTIRATERRKQHLTAAGATPLTMIPASACGYLTMIYLDRYGGVAVLLAFALRRIHLRAEPAPTLVAYSPLLAGASRAGRSLVGAPSGEPMQRVRSCPRSPQ